MKKLVVVMVATVLLIGGCVHQKQLARTPVTNPDGTIAAYTDPNTGEVIIPMREMEQTVNVGIAKYKEGMMDFSAEAVAADESGWSVNAGSSSKGADATTAMVEAIKLVGVAVEAMTAMQAQMAQMDQATEIARIEAGLAAPDTNPADLLSLLVPLLERQQANRPDLAGIIGQLLGALRGGPTQ